MTENLNWRHTTRPGGYFWIAEMGRMELRVRPARPPRHGQFVGYINTQRVGYWSSADVARFQLERLAFLHHDEALSELVEA
jgi:hypothetical protein